MKDCKLVVGSVVLSNKGRDKGNYFVVVALNGDLAFIADGDKHMLISPKKKNIKHLAPNGEVLPVIAQKLQLKRKVFDSEVRSALRQFNQPSENNQ